MGLGVILEAPKIFSIPVAAVFIGVVIEAACTLLLFEFDEGITSTQKVEIISLQKSNEFLLSQGQELEALAIRARREAAKATERAAQLEKDAAMARASVADANARAAEASQKAAEAELALEKLKTPRTLGLARQQAVAAAVRPFAGQRYETAISDAADDGLVFWQSLCATLESAGWMYLPPPPGQPSKGVPAAYIPIAAIPGVEILFDPAKESEVGPAALALGNALHADGMVVAVNRELRSKPNEAERDILFIRIGARVPPP